MRIYIVTLYTYVSKSTFSMSITAFVILLYYYIMPHPNGNTFAKPLKRFYLNNIPIIFFFLFLYMSIICTQNTNVKTIVYRYTNCFDFCRI